MPREWTHRLLRQTITWWAVSGQDGYGKPAYAAPMTIKGRWEARVRHFRAADGEVKVSKAEVRVDREVPAGDWLALGDHCTELDPAAITGAGRVMAYEEVWNVPLTSAERVALL